MIRQLVVATTAAGAVCSACAQSSVNVFGTLDMSGKYVKDDGSAKRLSLARDGLNSSQLGFRGLEDLGGGLKAGFTLIASVGGPTGDIGSGVAANRFWSRRATLSLLGNWGELRLGRDYTPIFISQGGFDPFGYVGVGATFNNQQMTTTTTVRADNSIDYFTPSTLGGFYGQFMAAAGEPGYVGSNNGRFLSGRVGYAAGPGEVAFAYADQLNTFGVGTRERSYNLGGTYDFKVFKLMTYVDVETGPSRRETRGELGGIIPFGVGEVHFGYDRSQFRNNSVAVGYSNKVDQLSVGYVYNFSKRTALYGTVSELRNGPHSSFAVAAAPSITALPTPGGKSQGAEVGIRHFF